jgi:general secretion pathway protein G
MPTNYKEGGYISKIPLDPWGNSYIYLCPGTHFDYDLVSYGADGEPGGEGDNADIANYNLE